MKRLLRVIFGLLKELSDESAYRRHLAAHNLRDSREAWRDFSNARFQKKFSNPKCC
ncbi:MAG: hypothetical protein IT159_02445 [Bryobacterales bacterium]|nr:hypothetical protein [Bryobacterales bacterium]